MECKFTTPNHTIYQVDLVGPLKGVCNMQIYVCKTRSTIKDALRGTERKKVDVRTNGYHLSVSVSFQGTPFTLGYLF